MPLSIQVLADTVWRQTFNVDLHSNIQNTSYLRRQVSQYRLVFDVELLDSLTGQVLNATYRKCGFVGVEVVILFLIGKIHLEQTF